MRSRFVSVVAVFAGLCLPPVLRADDPDTKEIIKAADDATKAIKSVAYEAEFFAEGYLKDQVPHITGRVQMKKPKSSMLSNILGGGGFPLYAEGAVKMPGSVDETTFKVATNGKRVYLLDEAKKTLTTGDFDEGQQQPFLRYGQRMAMLEYVVPNPFSDELEADSREYEGVRKVGDEECHVIYVKYSRGRGEARWYYSKKDYLPRRVDRVFKRDDDAGELVTLINKIEVDPKFKKGVFRIKAPDGYEEKQLGENEDEDENKSQLLTIGSKAPDFELKTPDGDSVSLKKLHGQVVVLEFWATWYAPCKASMKGLQKVHQQFEDKPVKIFGVNCWERDGDPVKFMKDKDYTFGLLLKGDKVADLYKVTGIPTFYVIDPQGKIVYAETFKPGHEKILTEVIEKALKNSEND